MGIFVADALFGCARLGVMGYNVVEVTCHRPILTELTLLFQLLRLSQLLRMRSLPCEKLSIYLVSLNRLSQEGKLVDGVTHIS